MLRINESMAYPAPASEVAAMYATEAYGKKRAESLGSTDVAVTVTGDAASGFELRTSLVAPTALIPAKYRKFVGSNLEVTEIQTWSAPNELGEHTGSIVYELKGVPARCSGTFTLGPDSSGSTMRLQAEVSVNVPLVGSQLEKAAEPYFSHVFALEQKTATAYLRDNEGEAALKR